MLAFIRLLLVVVFIIFSAIFGLTACLLRPFHRDNVRLVSSWYAKAAWIFGISVEIRPSAAAQAAMPCVFVANHQNNYDLFTISGALISGTVTIGKQSLKWIPFFGQLYWLSGNILIDRQNKSKAVGAMQGAVTRIKNDGLSVWVFPEGTRSYGRGLLPFKTGAFHIAQQAGVPIVPICMSQTHGKIKLNRWNNGKVIITYLPPIMPDEMAVSARDAAAHIHQLMADEIARLDTELAASTSMS